MLLTNDEISDIYEQPSKTPREFARAIESAVLTKLLEQEPVKTSAPEWQPINGECNHDGLVAVLYTSEEVRISHSNWIGKQIVKPYSRPAMLAYMASIDEGCSHWLPIPNPPMTAARSE